MAAVLQGAPIHTIDLDIVYALSDSNIGRLELALLLDFGSAGWRAVPRQALSVVTAPERQPDREDGNRAGPEGEIERTHA